MTLSLACADMLLQSHEDQGGALLMPSAHGSNNYSSEMRSILPGISLQLRYYELLGQQNVLLRARRYLVLCHQDLPRICKHPGMERGIASGVSYDRVLLQVCRSRQSLLLRTFCVPTRMQ